jgi:hypothetical protein
MEAFLPKGLLETYDLEQALANERRRVRDLEAHIQMLDRTIYQNNINHASAMRHIHMLESTLYGHQHNTPPPYSYTH